MKTLALAVPLLLGIQLASAADKPNIVLFFIDDWAWNGTPIRMDDDMPNSQMPGANMPNLVRLAGEGMKFRNAYSGAPQCSPSRVCLQTGQTAARSGYTVFLGNTKDPYYDTRRQYQTSPSSPPFRTPPSILTPPPSRKPLRR